MRTSPPRAPTEHRSADGSACARSRDADPGPGRRGGAGRRGPLPAGGVLRWSRLPGPGPGSGARRPPPSATDRRGGRRPRPAAVVGRSGCCGCRDADDPRLHRRDRPYGHGRRHRRGTRGRCPDRALSGARRGGGVPAGDGPARPHPGRPGRDGAAGTGPRIGDPVAGRDGHPLRTRRAPAAAPARGAPVRHRAGLPRERPGPVARSAQQRSVLRPRTGAADRAADAGGRARPRDLRGAGPDRCARPRRRRSARRAGRGGGPGDGPPGMWRAGGVAGGASPAGDRPLAPAGARPRGPVRRSPVRGRGAGHRLARSAGVDLPGGVRVRRLDGRLDLGPPPR